MPIFPCASKSLCLDPATPFQNFTAEAPDAHIFIARSTGFGPQYPPLGSDFIAVGCTTFCESTVSQEEADLCAQRGNVECLSGVWPVATPGVDVFGNPVPVYHNRPVFFSRAQTATVLCPDGNPFTYTVPAGKYAAFNQASADAAALSDAQVLAALNQLCIGNLASTQICSDTPYVDSVTASGAFLDPATTCWDILGVLPTGIETDLTGSETCRTGSNTLNFFGTPTVPGIYGFAIQVQDGKGNFMVKPVTIRVMGITNSQPFPDGNVGVAYSEFIDSLGVTNPIYSLESGALPDGLALDSTGVIFGSPTAAGTFDFVLGVTEAGTGITCNTPGEITIVAAGLNFNDAVWGVPTASTAGTGFIVAFSNVGSQIAADSGVTGPGNGSAALANSGSFPYDGPLVNCNAHIEVLVANGLLGANNLIVRDSAFNIYLFQDVSGLGVGVFDIPFVIPALVLETITVSWSCNMAFNANVRELSFTVALTPAF